MNVRVRFLCKVKHDKTHYSGDCDVDNELARTFIAQELCISLDAIDYEDEERLGEPHKVTDKDVLEMNRRQLMSECSRRGIRSTFRDTVSDLRNRLGVKADGN